MVDYLHQHLLQLTQIRDVLKPSLLLLNLSVFPSLQGPIIMYDVLTIEAKLCCYITRNLPLTYHLTKPLSKLLFSQIFQLTSQVSLV